MQKKILYLGLRCPADGENVVHYPIIKTEPVAYTDDGVQRTFKDIDQFTHFLFTSQTSVEVFFSYFSHFKIQKEQIKNKCYIAVGKSTAAMLAKYGINVDICPQNETAEGIIEELRKISLNGSYILWPRSAIARDILSTYFKQNSIPFMECIVYNTFPNIPKPLPDLSEFSEIVFTSPSTVDAFFSVFKNIPKQMKLNPIGPITNSRLNYFLECPNKLKT